MTDEKSPDLGQPDHNTRAKLEENGQLNLLGDADTAPPSDQATESGTNEKPIRASRGLRRPRAASTPIAASTDSTNDLLSKAEFRSSIPPDSDRARPTGITDIDDVLDKDILFNFVNTPMLDEESLHATVEDVESSLQILADDDSDTATKERSDSTEHTAVKPEINDPLVLVKRRRSGGRHYADCIPEPLPVEHGEQRAITPTKPDDSVSARPVNLRVADQTIEDVAHDAVQMMSRSIDAAGGSVLNLELAREIRLNLTELLSEWQIEQLTRNTRSDAAEQSLDLDRGEAERKNDLNGSSNTYQFRPISD